LDNAQALFCHKKSQEIFSYGKLLQNFNIIGYGKWWISIK